MIMMIIIIIPASPTSWSWPSSTWWCSPTSACSGSGRQSTSFSPLIRSSLSLSPSPSSYRPPPPSYHHHHFDHPHHYRHLENSDGATKLPSMDSLSNGSLCDHLRPLRDAWHPWSWCSRRYRDHFFIMIILIWWWMPFMAYMTGCTKPLILMLVVSW